MESYRQGKTRPSGISGNPTSRAILQQRRRNFEKEIMNLVLEMHFIILQSYLFTFRTMLRYGTSGFTFPANEGVLRIFMFLKTSLPRPGLNPRTLCSVARTLTIIPPRRYECCYSTHCLHTGYEVPTSLCTGKVVVLN
jgi:hypothetical protein